MLKRALTMLIVFSISFSAISRVEQARGFYSNGTLIHASQFPNEGSNFVKIFRPLNRSWTTTDLQLILEKVSAQMSTDFPAGERLQVGDLSAEEGGPISDHKSHQNGLDVDLVYYRNNKIEEDPEAIGKFTVDSSFEKFVLKGKVTENFDIKRNLRLMQLLEKTGRVDRIFVDQAIKNLFCTHLRKAGQFKENIPMLRKLRHFDGHADHLHVRLTCPKDSPACKSQAPLPQGSGCP